VATDKDRAQSEGPEGAATQQAQRPCFASCNHHLALAASSRFSQCSHNRSPLHLAPVADKLSTIAPLNAPRQSDTPVSPDQPQQSSCRPLKKLHHQRQASTTHTEVIRPVLQTNSTIAIRIRFPGAHLRKPQPWLPGRRSCSRSAQTARKRPSHHTHCVAGYHPRRQWRRQDQLNEPICWSHQPPFPPVLLSNAP
jgi:hypothetical protein